MLVFILIYLVLSSLIFWFLFDDHHNKHKHSFTLLDLVGCVILAYVPIVNLFIVVYILLEKGDSIIIVKRKNDE